MPKREMYRNVWSEEDRAKLRAAAEVVKGKEGFSKCVKKAGDKVTIDVKCYREKGEPLKSSYSAAWE